MHFSVAIVGMGPRGLSVLERICGLARVRWPGGLTVHVIDPDPPGPGVHRPGQPDYLLMNTIAGQVSMFRTGDSAALGWPVSGPSLAGWAGVEDSAYLPRSALGRYLSYCYRRYLEEAPEFVQLREHRATAEALRLRRNLSWLIHLSDGSDVAADYVFLTVGHGTNKPTPEDVAFEEFAATHRRVNPRLRFVRSCYPLEQLDSIVPGSHVGIRGMGLSAIDTVARLTTGRGGRFAPRSGGRLTYHPSGAEPHIYVYSRSARIFWARAVNQKGPSDAYQASYLTEDEVSALRRNNGQLDFQDHVLPLLLADMQVAAGSAGQRPDFREIEPILRPPNWDEQKTLDGYQAAIAGFLAEDVDRAAEGNRRNPVKAATDAIRDMRDQLRSAVEHRGLTPASHQRFYQEHAPILNSVAAGPPASRSHQWRALFDRGIMRLGAGPGARARAAPESASFLIEGHQRPSPVTRCDVLIGAVLDPFVPDRDTSPLTRSLLSAGYARSFANGWFRPGGFDIDEAGRLINARGRPTPNICALGHITEGPHYYTNMLPAPGADSRVTADAATAVAAMSGDLHRTYSAAN